MYPYNPKSSRKTKTQRYKYVAPAEPVIMPNYCLSDKAIVLDIDSTLLHTYDNHKKLLSLGLDDKYDKVSLDIKSRILIYEIDGKKYWSILRPGVKEFLIDCYSLFKYVIFWTAGNKAYAVKIVQLLHLYGPQHQFIFSRDDIKTIYEMEIETEKGKEVENVPIKDLKILISKLKSEYDVHLKQEDIIVIDDVESTFSRNDKNAIWIPEFKPKPVIEKLSEEDDCFARITNWIYMNINKDMTCVAKEHIFL
jgi:hypothetical protein